MSDDEKAGLRMVRWFSRPSQKKTYRWYRG